MPRSFSLALASTPRFKRLIRDALVHVIQKNEQAHDKLEHFAAEKLGTGGLADTKVIARYLVAPHPRQPAHRGLRLRVDGF